MENPKFGTNICNQDGTDTVYQGVYGEQQEEIACVHGYRVVVLPPLVMKSEDRLSDSIS